ncbi:MAG: DUF3179 domain-containing protein [Acidimicrobiaceae bacterium]|nr:DUF3179 domain-containing protein [Acidimicrobiaceae bacterium]MYG56005.1 DUF3179 domain-containing protein [Acidimicrobiaceae bacterium]MYJ99998.1 DUF3179 domain-containing protein [Acidimicrobiaceae bacterium]
MKSRGSNHMIGHRVVALVVFLGLVAAACGSDDPLPEAVPEDADVTDVSNEPSESTGSDDVDEANPSADDDTTSAEISPFGPAPASPSGPLDPALEADLNILFDSLRTNTDLESIDRVGASGDPRAAWLLTDIIRFVRIGEILERTSNAWESLTDVSIPANESPWGFTTNHMIAWDVPAPPGYINWKRQLFELVEPRWAPLFDDPEATVDWRWVSWGGVYIDDRAIGQTNFGCPQGCIPALNDPALTPAADGSWYPDVSIVFGVVVGDEAVAFPKNIMEIHEMVNITIGGRRLGIPYCTLCGSAQAYFTDDVSPRIDTGGYGAYELRTSGLLSRSNKVMFEFHTMSVMDTFTGEALSGPLREAGVVLRQTSVRTSTWGDWKAAHPDTRIVAEDGGIGRTYPRDPLRGRDDHGPIFPIGDVDPRLEVQEPVVGVISEDNTPVAFPVGLIEPLTADGASVTFGGVTVTSDGAGFTVTSEASGDQLAAHQAFWFAWSQFHTNTLLFLG